jgi:hypothetical protein
MEDVEAQEQEVVLWELITVATTLEEQWEEMAES